MNREQAKELLPVIQAFAEGKTIQADYRNGPQGWRDYEGTCPGFDNENWRWRVKPEPREWWIIISKAGADLAYPKLPESIDAIHVREVLE